MMLDNGKLERHNSASERIDGFMFPQHLTEDLSNCLKCAMCQAVCPTYQVTRMERHSPRGRVQMVRHYLQGDLAVSKGLQEALMSCLMCESCTTACPSGVRLDRVFENMRVQLNHDLGNKLSKKALFAALNSPILMRLGARLARFGLDIIPLPRNLGAHVGNIPLARLPKFNKKPFRDRIGERVQSRSPRLGRVIYFTGCATDLIYEDVGHAVINVLTTLGLEVLIPKDQVCCSVPMFLSGAREQALPNIEKNLAILDRGDVDYIVVDCATCGGALKKGIPHLLDDMGLDTEKAIRIANKVKDVTEIVADNIEKLPLQKPKGADKVSVTYHDPCHLVRSMKVAASPRLLLKALEGVNFIEMQGHDQCCGGAGSFQFEHVDMSAGVTARKKENIRATGASLVATGCPGCRLTLSGNLGEQNDPLVRHTIQLVEQRLP